MARFSKKKVIKKKSVNKNKNTRGRKRVSRGKSRRRVKRKYVGGLHNDNQAGNKTDPKYYTIKPDGEAEADSKNLYKYIEDLLEVGYLAIVVIFLLCGPIRTGSAKEITTAKTAIQTKLGENYPESLVNKLLVPGVKVSYKSGKAKGSGGALKGGGDKWTRLKKLLRITGETIQPPPGFRPGEQAPYIDISLPTLEEMKATDFDFDILKMDFIIDKINAEIAALKASQPEIENIMSGVTASAAEVSALSDPPHINTVTTDNAILASLRARISLNELLIELNRTSPTPPPTLPDGLDSHKELVKQIAIDAVNYNLENPGSKVVISEATYGILPENLKNQIKELDYK
jgi:hypothetical protein